MTIKIVKKDAELFSGVPLKAIHYFSGFRESDTIEINEDWRPLKYDIPDWCIKPDFEAGFTAALKALEEL